MEETLFQFIALVHPRHKNDSISFDPGTSDRIQSGFNILPLVILFCQCTPCTYFWGSQTKTEKAWHNSLHVDVTTLAISLLYKVTSDAIKGHI